MGKNKNHKNKDAVEFVLVNRGMDDPNYNNPQAPGKVLLHVPKDDTTKPEHEIIINQIPEISRGVYSEKAIHNSLKELGINSLNADISPEDLAKAFNDANSQHFNAKVKSELINGVIGEEIVVTTFKDNNENIKSTGNVNSIDAIFAKGKVDAAITEYNKFGLRKDIDPEVLNYITDKEFQEGVDIFIPAPEGTPIDANRFDIDIPVEKMDQEHKDLYDAMQEVQGPVEELEDDFILLANEGVLPISLEGKEKLINEEADEMVLAETKDRVKNPSYKFITKEEKEMLDKILQEKKNATKEDTQKVVYKGMTAKYDDEDEYEDYELDDEEDFEELNEEEEINNHIDHIDHTDHTGQNEEEIIVVNVEKSSEGQKGKYNITFIEEKIEYFENNFKIDFGEKKQNKKGKLKKKSQEDENFTIDDLNTLIHDENFVKATLNLCENHVDDKNADEEGLPIYYIKKRLDITAVHGKIGYLPKTVGVANERPQKVIKLSDDSDTENTKSHQGKSIVLNSNKPLLPLGEESKDEKKLRKKLVKEEKKEKRKQKKELKDAFQVG